MLETHCSLQSCHITSLISTYDCYANDLSLLLTRTILMHSLFLKFNSVVWKTIQSSTASCFHWTPLAYPVRNHFLTCTFCFWFSLLFYFLFKQEPILPLLVFSHMTLHLRLAKNHFTVIAFYIPEGKSKTSNGKAQSKVLSLFIVALRVAVLSSFWIVCARS